MSYGSGRAIGGRGGGWRLRKMDLGFTTEPLASVDTQENEELLEKTKTKAQTNFMATHAKVNNSPDREKSILESLYLFMHRLSSLALCDVIGVPLCPSLLIQSESSDMTADLTVLLLAVYS